MECSTASSARPGTPSTPSPRRAGVSVPASTSSPPRPPGPHRGRRRPDLPQLGVTTPQHDLGCITIVDYTFTWNRTQLPSPTRQSTAHPPPRPSSGSGPPAYAKHLPRQPPGERPVTSPSPQDGTTASDGLLGGHRCHRRLPLVSGSYTALTARSRVGRARLNALAASGLHRHPRARSSTSRHPTGLHYQRVRMGRVAALVRSRTKRPEVLGPPRKAPDGFTVRIIQQSGTNQDDYFVKFVRPRGDGTGIWEECLAPGAQLGLDKNDHADGAGLRCRLEAQGARLEAAGHRQRGAGQGPRLHRADRPGRDLLAGPPRDRLRGRSYTLLRRRSVPALPAHPRARLDSDPIGRVNPAPGETTFRYAIPFETAWCCAGTTSRPGHLRWHPHPDQGQHRHYDAARAVQATSAPAVNGKLYFATPKGATPPRPSTRSPWTGSPTPPSARTSPRPPSAISPQGSTARPSARSTTWRLRGLGLAPTSTSTSSATPTRSASRTPSSGGTCRPASPSAGCSSSTPPSTCSPARVARATSSRWTSRRWCSTRPRLDHPDVPRLKVRGRGDRASTTPGPTNDHDAALRPRGRPPRRWWSGRRGRSNFSEGFIPTVDAMRPRSRQGHQAGRATATSPGSLLRWPQV
jgi:hypothetical protein